MPTKIIAISANTKPVRFITNTFNRFDHTTGYELTDNPNLAKDFNTISWANITIGKLYNPFERLFKAVEIEVTEEQRVDDVQYAKSQRNFN